MLRALLEDRFTLRYHRETKSAEVYALVKKGATLGPKMNRSPEAACPDNPTGANFCGVSARPGLCLRHVKSSMGQTLPVPALFNSVLAIGLWKALK